MCSFTHKSYHGNSSTAIYTSNDEPEKSDDNHTSVHNFAQQFGGGVLIDLLGTLGNIKLNNCTTYINTQYTIDQVNFYMCIRFSSSKF